MGLITSIGVPSINQSITSVPPPDLVITGELSVRLLTQKYYNHNPVQPHNYGTLEGRI